MGDKDFTNSCVEDIRSQGKRFKSFSASDLRKHFCTGCRQPACGHAKGLENPWEERILTQVDRLLENPVFAEPDDPRIAHLQGLDFPSLYREAIRLQIAQKRGDWTTPSEEEVEAAMLLGPDLSMVDTSSQVEDAVRALKNKGEPPAPAQPKVETIQVWSKTNRNVSYSVTVNEKGTAVSCTCKGGQYGRRCAHKFAAEKEWKVLQETKSPADLPEEDPQDFQGETLAEVPVELPPPGIRPQPSVDRPYRNLAMNSPHPQGVMLGGGAPPAPGIPHKRGPVRDAWSPKSNKVSPANVVVTLKGKKKDE